MTGNRIQYETIRVSFKCFFFNPGLRIFTISPNFDEIVTSCTGKMFNGVGLVWCLRGWGGLGLGLGCDERTGDDGGSPKVGCSFAFGLERRFEGLDFCEGVGQHGSEFGVGR
jgi:hypothetical protein